MSSNNNSNDGNSQHRLLSVKGNSGHQLSKSANSGKTDTLQDPVISISTTTAATMSSSTSSSPLISSSLGQSHQTPNIHSIHVGSGSNSPSPHKEGRVSSSSRASLFPASSSTSRRKGTVSSTVSFMNPKDVLMSVSSVVKNRTGSVLARQTILKADHFETGLDTHLDFALHGAPNFRLADMNIYGVAQPTYSGIAATLTLLNCHRKSHAPLRNSTTIKPAGDVFSSSISPTGPVTHTTYWFSAREEPLIYLNRKPFVLREADRAFQNIKTYQGINSSRLEAMETRLKEDVIRESQKWNGLFLIHEEKDGKIIPCWMALDSVQTPREVFECLEREGFNVMYVRIPISPEQAPEDTYIDEYVQAIRKTSAMDHLVFNCGMGVGRTTFAMVLAMLIRRAQLLTSGNIDPFQIEKKSSQSGMDTNGDSVVNNSDIYDKAMLRLVYLLDKALAPNLSSRSVIEWTLARGHLIEDLRNALLGNYVCIQQLMSVLKQGSLVKRALDEAIDRCAVLVNLRENILLYRVRYTTTGNQEVLQKASGFLERYFFLLAFASYVEEATKSSFSDWLQARTEIWNMLETLRRKMSSLTIFRPADDLSVFSSELKRRDELLGWGPSKISSGSQGVTEMDKHVIKSRRGNVLGSHTILKMDFWTQSKTKSLDTTLSMLPGASNFRKIPNSPIYGVAQPTLRGMTNVIHALEGNPATVLWLNMREEPLIYINGVPYVLRDQYVTLRNIKSYSGITGERLEQIEAKLVQDVQTECRKYDGQVLLHTEAEDGTIIPIWEDCSPDCVQTLRDVMETIATEEAEEHAHHDHHPIRVLYRRVPVTAESRPDAADFDSIVNILSAIDIQSTSIVINCQMGMGRSTTGTIVTSLVLRWLQGFRAADPSSIPSHNIGNYQVIHSLLRVIRNGLECKRLVDKAIDDCGLLLNLRNSIEDCRQQAEAEHDEEQKQSHTQRGLVNLNRYFFLILFQAYLDQNEPGLGRELMSFKDWLKAHPEFETIRVEMESGGLSALVPVAELRPGDGIALSNEVLTVVNNRAGSVLTQGTIVKFDLFPGAQKLSLAERLEGAPNFRTIPLPHFRSSEDIFAQWWSQSDWIESPAPSWVIESNDIKGTFSVSGVGMPTRDGIKRVLSRMNAGLDGSRTVLWTSLREEPVVYVNGRAFVLRLFQDPIRNLEITGIARERVELMEVQLRNDLIADMRRYNGRLLLHEERVEGSSFSIVPVWETVKEEDIQTPLDIYDSIRAEGYQVDYLRIPITDEQAPIPDVFNQLVDRLLNISPSGDAIFNCQMGRGRTTTGMVITCLMQMIVGNQQHIFDMLREDGMKVATPPEEQEGETDSTNLDSASNTQEKTMSLSGSTSLFGHNTQDSQVELQELYRAGEYKLVMQLISVLQYGKIAKRLTDKAIDTCDHMQNLRLAIDDYRVRLSAVELGSRKYHTILETGCNYLVRYFYLITFADYLIEEWSSWTPEMTLAKKPKLFSAWLEDRREIQNIIRKSNQSLD